MCEKHVVAVGFDNESLVERQVVEMQDEELYIDDVHGDFLDLDLLKRARVEQLAGYREMQVSCHVLVVECGSYKVYKMRWVDTNEGDELCAV